MTATRSTAVVRSVITQATRIPFTVVFLVVVLLGTLVLSRPGGLASSVRKAVGTGLDPLAFWGHWWSPVTASLTADGYISLVLTLVLGGTVLAMSERRMGTTRTAIAFVATTIAADVLGATIQAVVGIAGGLWPDGVQDTIVVGPLTGVAGAVMAASAFATARTRRRMRVLTTLVALMFLLYRGEPVDLYRSLAVVVGYLLGLALKPGPYRPEWRRSSHHEVRVLMASVVAAGAIGPIIAVLSRHPHGLLAPIAMLLDNGAASDPRGLQSCSVYVVSRACVQGITLERIGSVGPIALSILPLLILLVVAWGLLRGRRFAVGLGIAMNAGLAICSAYYLGFLPRSGIVGVEPVPHQDSWGVIATLVAAVAAPAATAVLLFLTRNSFTVRPRGRAVARYLVIVAVTAFALTALYVVLGWSLRYTAFDRPVGLDGLMFDAVERFIPVEFLHREIPDFLPTSPVGGALYHGVGPVFWAVVIAAAIPPLVARPASSAADAERARRILRTYGGDHLSFMTTWSETSYWFGSDGTTGVGYRVVGGVAITIGAAFGRTDAIAEAMTGFARHCDDHGWTPAFYSVDAKQWDDHFAADGWDRLVIAEEAVITPQSWSTAGKKWQNVRTAVNRASRDGLSLEWTSYPRLPRESGAQIADISEQWVADKELPELGFTLGGLDELRDPELSLMLARAADGSIQAVTSWMPGYRDGRIEGWTLDFMRRRVDGPNGVMEFMIAGTAERLKEDGAAYMSLSASPLARSGEGSSENPIDTVLRLLATSLESLYGFRSLLSFKRKFEPELRPLLLAYPDPAALPTIGLALLRAYLPGLTVRGALAMLRRQ
ncbi:DUF2156 domain-containing protein [Humibacter soli]